MEILWREHPLSSTEVIERVAKERDWAANTVRTLLSRLVEKGHLKTSRAAGRMVYTPKSSREACVAKEGQSFLGRVFGGAAAPLLLHFAQSAKLTPEEARKLRALLDQKGRKK